MARSDMARPFTRGSTPIAALTIAITLGLAGAVSSPALAAGDRAQAVSILKSLAKGAELQAGDREVLESHYAISSLSRSERRILTKRVREDQLDLPTGIITALVAESSANFNNQ